jgi:hypothetical protein
MTAVACEVPAEHAAGNLWDVLRPAVRRRGERRRSRVFVDDSKVVHAAGLHVLEASVRAVLGRTAESLEDCVEALAGPAHPDLRREPWYTGRTVLPLAAEAEICATLAMRWRTRQSLVWLPVRCVVVCPERFNGLLDRWDSKAAVLAVGLGELVQSMLSSAQVESAAVAKRRVYPNGKESEAESLSLPNEPIIFHIDKHGGRNRYGPMLQSMLTAGTVLAVQESEERSAYRVVGLDRPVELTFAPRADAEHPCVALASMVSKYLREVLMVEFNRFWQEHVPDLEPTAGYPGDAGRYYQAIKPVAARLGIAESRLWRRK